MRLHIHTLLYHERSLLSIVIGGKYITENDLSLVQFAAIGA